MEANGKLTNKQPDKTDKLEKPINNYSVILRLGAGTEYQWIAMGTNG